MLKSEDPQQLLNDLLLIISPAFKLHSEAVDPETSSESKLIINYLSTAVDDLFTILASQQPLLEIVILEALAYFISAAKLVHKKSSGTAIIQSLLRNHMKIIYHHLSSGNNAQIQAALFLLVQMGSHASTTTTELQSIFNFNLKALSKFLNLRKKSSSSHDFQSYRKKDIRTLYVQFLLALLRKGDAQSRQNLIEMNDLLGSILIGISLDPFEVIESTLIAIQKIIVDNDQLSKNIKLRFLTIKNLERMLQLYESNNQQSRELGHLFFIHIFTRPGHGVCYQDNGFYEPEKKGVKMYNKILHGILEKLSLQDNLQKILLTEILKSCPELLKTVIMMDLPKNFGAEIWSPPSPVVLSETIIPKSLSKTILVKFLSNSKLEIKTIGAQVLCAVFKKLKSYISEMVKLSKIYDYSSSKWMNCEKSFLINMKAKIPDFQTILTLINFSNNVNENLELKRISYQLLSDYQEFYPDSVLESRFNPGKVLVKDLNLLPIDIRRLILNFIKNTSDFAWWNMSEDSSKSYLEILLDIFLENESYQEEFGSVIEITLSNHFPFQNHSKEVFLWLSSLSFETNVTSRNFLKKFIDETLRDSYKNMYTVMDSTIATNIYKIASYEPFGYSLFCLVDGILKSIHKSVEEVEVIMKYACRLFLAFVKETQVTGDYIYNILANLHSNLKETEESEAVKLTLLSVENISDIISYYCNMENLDSIQKSARKNKKIKKFDFKSVIEAIDISNSASISEKILEIILCCQVNPLQLKAILCNCGDLPKEILSSLPFSVLLGFMLHGEIKCMQELLSIINLTQSKEKLESFFSQVVLELRFGTINYLNTKELLQIFMSILHKAGELNYDYQLHLLESESFKSFLELFFSEQKWMLSNDKQLENFYSIIFTLNELSKLSKVIPESLKTVLKNIKLHVSSGCHTDQFLSSISAFKTLIYLFDNDQDSQHLIKTMEHLMNKKSKIDFTEFIILLFNRAMESKILLKISSFEWLLNSFMSTKNEGVSKCILDIVSNTAGIKSNSWNLNQKVKNCYFYTSNSLISHASPLILNLITLNHVDKFLEICSPLNMRIICTLISANVEYTMDIFKKLQTSLDTQESINCQILLSCLYSNFTKDNKKTIWGDGSIKEPRKLSKLIWKKLKTDIIESAILSITKDEELNEISCYNFNKSISMFGLKEKDAANIFENIKNAIPSMKCHNLMTSNFHNYFPGLLSMCIEQNLNASELVVILMRIFRGYILNIKNDSLPVDFNDRVAEISKDFSDLVKLITDSQSEISFKDDHLAHFGPFVNSLLKSHPSNRHITNMISNIFKISIATKKELYDPFLLLEMIFSHSKFESIISANPSNNFDLSQENSKSGVVSLIKIIIESYPIKCCKPQFLNKLIDSYNGTMSESDRLLLSIFFLYESAAGISVLDRQLSKWVNESDDTDLISMIQPTRMIQTLNNFDIYQELEQNIVVFNIDSYPLYDISFFLPLITAMTSASTDGPLDPLLLIRANLFGVAAMGLSSQNIDTRKAASFAMESCDQLVRRSDIKDRNQLLLVFESLKQAIDVDDSGVIARIPTLISSFVAQAFIVQLKPESAMYSIINRFLLQRPMIDLNDIPIFYELLFSGTDLSRRERIWILNLLGSGLSCYEDYKLYKRRHVIDMLFGLFQSPIADIQIKKIIFEIIFKCARDKMIIIDMVYSSGIISFFRTCALFCDLQTLNHITLALPNLIEAVSKGLVDEKSILQLQNLENVFIELLKRIILQYETQKTLEIQEFFMHTVNVLSKVSAMNLNQRSLSNLSCREILKIKDILLEIGDEETFSKTSVFGSAPSDAVFYSMLPKQSLRAKDVMKDFLKLVMISPLLSFSDAEFMDVAYWACDFNLNLEKSDLESRNSFILWMIKCRLESPELSFVALKGYLKWDLFVAELYHLMHIISREAIELNSGIDACNTLLVMMIRDFSKDADNIFEKLNEMLGLLRSPRELMGSMADASTQEGDDSAKRHLLKQLLALA